MRSTAFHFWSDESGFIVSAELVLIATILVLGLIVGMTSVQNAIVFQLNNIGWAFSSLNQSFFIPGFFGCKGASSAGSFFVNQNLNAACFVVSTGGVGAYGPGFVGGGYGGFSDATFGIGPATSAATRTETVPAPVTCPPDSLQGLPGTPGDCPPASTVTPGSSPVQCPAVVPGSTGVPGSLTAPGSLAPSTRGPGNAPFLGGTPGFSDYSSETAPPRPAPQQ